VNGKVPDDRRPVQVPAAVGVRSPWRLRWACGARSAAGTSPAQARPYRSRQSGCPIRLARVPRFTVPARAATAPAGHRRAGR
jgi:hypothetical protein